jgi:hypothetical protein
VYFIGGLGQRDGGRGKKVTSQDVNNGLYRGCWAEEWDASQ